METLNYRQVLAETGTEQPIEGLFKYNGLIICDGNKQAYKIAQIVMEQKEV